MVGIDVVNHIVHVVPQTCGRWDCVYCADWKARQHAAQLFAAKPERQICLMVPHGNFKTPAEAYEFLKGQLPRFANLIRTGDPDRDGKPRITPRTFEYAAVWDFHKDGYPHVHLATWGDYLPREQVQPLWERLTQATDFYVGALTDSATHRHNFIKYLKEKPPDLPNSAAHPRRVTYSRHYHRTVNTPKLVESRAEAKWLWLRVHPYLFITWLRLVKRAIPLDSDNPNEAVFHILPGRLDDTASFINVQYQEWLTTIPHDQIEAIKSGQLELWPSPDAEEPPETDQTRSIQSAYTHLQTDWSVKDLQNMPKQDSQPHIPTLFS